jgi:hypothetical protein
MLRPEEEHGIIKYNLKLHLLSTTYTTDRDILVLKRNIKTINTSHSDTAVVKF